jgi:hypothetical protein
MCRLTCFTVGVVVVAALLVVVWPAGQTTTNNAATINAPIKPAAVNAVVTPDDECGSAQNTLSDT